MSITLTMPGIACSFVSTFVPMQIRFGTERPDNFSRVTCPAGCEPVCFDSVIEKLYEDDEIIVVNKPSGLSSQPGEGVRISLVEAFERDFGIGAFPVHRLDRETAGCLVFAKSAAGARKWTELVASKSVVRTYRAACGGIPENSSGLIDDPVGVKGELKSALTRYRLVARLEDGEVPPLSWLELTLGTGRGHQIRIHLASRGLPVLGDDRHGDFALNRSLKKSLGVRRLMLWARSLRLPDGREVRSAIPDHIAAFLRHFPDCPENSGVAEDGQS
jgi:23S rRNA pseudouridine955/2504/2580 synthase